MADTQMTGVQATDTRPQKRKSDPEDELSELEEHLNPQSKRPRRQAPFRTRPTVTLKTGRVTPTVIPQKKKAKNPRRDTFPIMFLALPTADSAQKTVANPFVVVHNTSTIRAANTLAEHHQKYGGIAMPDQDSFRAWLEDNKREFARARLSRRAAKQRVQRLQVAPRPAQADVPVPAVGHPAVRPNQPRQPAARASNGGIVRQARKCCRQLVEGIASGLNVLGNILGRQIYTDADVEEDRLLARIQERHELAGPEGQEIEAHLERVLEQAAPVASHSNNVDLIRSLFDDEMDTDSEAEEDEEPEHSTVPSPATAGLGPGAGTPAEGRVVYPVMPPLDPRFFHPDGRLHSAYKYLTAQIPLPRQWVDWALANGIDYVPGRGSIKRKGTYVADDTFDYDALHRVIHSGAFRTGDFEIGKRKYPPV
ncbi:hypothetical protein F5X99DRAFT_364956 [Biscogniauxia marginata]|nr:hypothetical protein F5X99DRAFT_364956 [Biscogniauxia marginata]